jgi:hypothetical protein
MVYVRFSSPPSVSVAPGPIPRIKIGTQGTVDNIEASKPAYRVWYREAHLDLGGITFSEVNFDNFPTVSTGWKDVTNFEVALSFSMHRHLVDAVESKRAHDVQCQLRAAFIVAREQGPPEWAGGSLQFKVSEAEWIPLLEQGGYHAGWTMYIERGDVEGWDIVAGHLKEAREHLLSRNPVGVLTACRAAIRKAEGVVNPDWAAIAPQIDRGSSPEGSFPPKSKRIEELRRWTLLMADTGGHSENYNATPEDAEYVYGTTASLLAYLSRKEAQAERSRLEAAGHG